MNKNYDVKIKILSPVHVGAGAEKNWVRGADFVHTNGRIYVLNQKSVWLSWDGDKRQQGRYLDYLGSGRFAEVERMIVDDLEIEEVSDFSFEYDGKLNSREIKTVMRDGNNDAYIPGSSIKGAMLSAIYHSLHEGIKPKSYNEQTEKELLGTFDRALGRYLRPYDTCKLPTEVNDVDLYNLYRKGMRWEGDFKSGFTIVTETFKPDTEGVFRLSIADDLGAFVKKQKGETALPTYYKNLFDNKPLETLFGIINKATNEHIQRELAFFEKYNDQEDIDLVLAQLEDLSKDLKNINNTSCILQMSFGSGFHGITGDYRFKDHTSTIENPDPKNLIYNRTTRQKEPARYKSRRLVFPYGGIMGFVKLTV